MYRIFFAFNILNKTYSLIAKNIFLSIKVKKNFDYKEKQIVKGQKIKKHIFEKFQRLIHATKKINFDFL